MDFKAHLLTAWRLTLDFIAPLIIITLAMFALWFISFGLLTPVTLAGYTQSLLRMLREKRPPEVGDLFSCMSLFLPLLGFSLLVILAVMIGFVFLVLPGILIGFFISFTCLYMLPLMTDQKLGLFAAIQKSYAMGIKQGSLSDHFVVVVIYVAITTIGSSVFIGSLFTQPLATVFLLSVYDEKI